MSQAERLFRQLRLHPEVSQHVLPLAQRLTGHPPLIRRVGSLPFVLDADGNLRVNLGTGGPAAAGGTQPEAAGVNVFASNGSRIGRLGTGPGGVAVNLVLRDRQDRDRVLLGVGEDGTPSIQLLDANGNVTWSAR